MDSTKFHEANFLFNDSGIESVKDEQKTIDVEKELKQEKLCGLVNYIFFPKNDAERDFFLGRIRKDGICNFSSDKDKPLPESKNFVLLDLPSDCEKYFSTWFRIPIRKLLEESHLSKEQKTFWYQYD